jgi:hypothetical protein
VPIIDFKIYVIVFDYTTFIEKVQFQILKLKSRILAAICLHLKVAVSFRANGGSSVFPIFSSGTVFLSGPLYPLKVLTRAFQLCPKDIFFLLLIALFLPSAL